MHSQSTAKAKKERSSEPLPLKPVKNVARGCRSAGSSPASRPRNSLVLPRLRSQSTSVGTVSPTANSPTTPVSYEREIPKRKNSQTEKPLPPNQRCPCKASSNGKSWLMTCNSCEQVWHNRCANLKGDKPTKEAVDSILKDWQCPLRFFFVGSWGSQLPCKQKISILMNFIKRRKPRTFSSRGGGGGRRTEVDGSSYIQILIFILIIFNNIVI